MFYLNLYLVFVSYYCASLFFLCPGAALHFTKRLFIGGDTQGTMQMEHRVMSEHPNSVFTVRVKTGYQCECWLECPFLSLSFSHMFFCSLSLSLSLSLCLFLCLSHSGSHTHTCIHSLFLSPSLCLLSVQLASGLHFPLEPVEGGALLCELG